MGSLAPANIQSVIKAAKLLEIKIIAIIYFFYRPAARGGK